METARLRLRAFRADDAAAVHAFASDPEVCRYTDWGPNNPEDTRAFLDDAVEQARQSPRQEWSLAVVTRHDDVLIGSCAVWTDSAQHRRGGLGFVLSRPSWGHGYATEATRGLLRLAVTALGLERVEATCRPGNVASQRVLERLGFRREGLLRAHVVVRGERQDSLLYARLLDDAP